MSEAGEFHIYFTQPRGRRGSREALYEALAFYTGRAFTEPEIQKEKEGKPFFSDPFLPQFSITHSGDYWMCVFGEQRVGIDLQIHRACRTGAISKRFFAPEERLMSEKSGYRDFFPIWAAKESYIKYTGRGLSEKLSGFSVVNSGVISGEGLDLDIRPLRFLPGYSLCVCSEKTDRVFFTDIAALKPRAGGE
ncbi:MAG: 4'-phosphopantetheinyl transferase superfamily protein [Oscillospiraceae bacterium]|nr:4'-phosphopantetheinyl transferase superfamily protein [Oscillospiraceae bacterium]